MNPSERWTSLSRHHTVLERETEKLREIAKEQAERLARVKRMFPGIELGPALVIPKPTPEWKDVTYRSKDGKWPLGIVKHLDWLSEEDFK